MFTSLKLWFRTRIFLSDMLVRYATDNTALMEENEKLRKKLGQKDKVLERALADHRQSNSFNRTVITNMQKRINELEKSSKEVSFTLPNGIKLIAEHSGDVSWESIDVVAYSPNGRFENICCADFDKGDKETESRGLRVFCFNGIDDDYCHEEDIDFSYLLAHNDLDPVTEQDYIDQIMQEKADKESE